MSFDTEVAYREALAARSPAELAAYLRAHSWTLDRPDGRTAAIWLKCVEGEEFEALQPCESTLRDYVARVRDLVHVLAIVEGRLEPAVLADIAAGMSVKEK